MSKMFLKELKPLFETIRAEQKILARLIMKPNTKLKEPSRNNVDIFKIRKTVKILFHGGR